MVKSLCTSASKKKDAKKNTDVEFSNDETRGLPTELQNAAMINTLEQRFMVIRQAITGKIEEL